MRRAALALAVVFVLAATGVARASSTAPVFAAPVLVDHVAPALGFGVTSLSCGSPTSCVAVGGTIAQFTTDAGTATAPTWSSPLVITTGSLVSVSCPTGSLCVAVTSNGTALSSSDGGMSWSAPVTIETESTITVVGCSVHSFCVASARASAGQPAAVYVSADGGATWSGPYADDSLGFTAMSCLASGVCFALDPLGGGVVVSSDVETAGPATWTRIGDLGATNGGYLTDLSCTPNGICVAVDTSGHAYVTTDANAASPAWSSVLADGTGDPSDGLVGLTSVACEAPSAVSATDVCVAGDTHGSTAVSTDVGGGNTWAVVPTFDTGNIQPANGGRYLYPLACVSTGWCMAATINGLAATYAVVPADPSATAWSTPPALLNGFDFMNAVSCSPNGQVCAALDSTGNAVTSVDGGAHWSAPVTVNPADGGAGMGSQGSAADGVSCVNSGRCVAVEKSLVLSPSSGDQVPFTLVLATTPTAAGATWTADPVDFFATLNGVPTSPQANGVSCVDSGLCVAVDAVGNAVISTDLGRSWTVDPTGDSLPIVAVSCASATSCVAVDNGGHVLASTNAAGASPSWTISPGVIDASPIASLSCASQGLCVAVDRKGQAVISSSAGSVWSKPAAINGSAGVALVSVSCTASALCVAVDAHGTAAFTLNPSAPAPTWTVASSNTADLTAISCVGTGLCVGVDAVGNAEVGLSQVGVAALSGASGTFPDTVIGTVSPAQTVHVTNTGSAPLNVGRATLSGPDAGEFAITGSTCDGTFVPPGGSCEVSLYFAPAGTGAYTGASLVITSDSGTTPDTVPLSGTGVLAPALAVTGGPALFASTAVGAVSAVAPVTATNSGGAPVHISIAALVGSDAGQFKLAAGAGCAGAALAPGASCTVGVTFAPSSAGRHAATLELDSDAPGGQVEVALSGTASSTPPQALAFSIASLRAGKRGLITAQLRLARAGSFVLSTSTMVPGKAHKRAKRIVYGRRVGAHVKGPTTASIRITPSRAAAAALKKARKLRVVVTVTFTPTGLRRSTGTSSVTVHAS